MASFKKINVAGVVIRDTSGRYLIVQEKRADIYGLWNIPAGHQDEGETLQQAAIREAQEETGLRVELIKDKPVYVGPTATRTHVFQAFPARIVGGKIKFPEDEILQVRWLTFQEIKILNQQGKVRHSSTMRSIEAVEHAAPYAEC